MSFSLRNDERRRVDISQEVRTNTLFANEISSKYGNDLIVKTNVTIEGDLTVEGDSTGITADFLATLGDPVNVSLSAPPLVDQILQATSPTTAVWQAGAEVISSGTAIFSGPWASSLSADFFITRIGKQVMMRLNAMGTAAQTSNSIITSNAFIPIGFRPFSSNGPHFIQTTNGGAKAGGIIIMKSDGTIELFKNFDNEQFNASPAGIENDHFFTWTTDV